LSRGLILGVGRCRFVKVSLISQVGQSLRGSLHARLTALVACGT